MTEPGTSRVVSERTTRRECGGCGTPLVYAGTGRPARFCSPSCRQRAWALRTAERTLRTDADPRPAVVHEVTERTVERAVRVAAPSPAWSASSAPTRAREWTALLDQLTGLLANDSAAVTREHWHHVRLYDALLGSLTALGRAHPGGLDQLQHRSR